MDGHSVSIYEICLLSCNLRTHLPFIPSTLTNSQHISQQCPTSPVLISRARLPSSLVLPGEILQDRWIEFASLIDDRGLGAGIAVLLAKRGANVVVNYVSESSAKRAQDVVDEINNKIGTKAVLCKANVSELDQIPLLIDAATKLSKDGKIDILIHK